MLVWVEMRKKNYSLVRLICTFTAVGGERKIIIIIIYMYHLVFCGFLFGIGCGSVIKIVLSHEFVHHSEL